MITQPIRRTLLEVERKFLGLTVHPLNANSGSPPFKSLTHLGSKSFRDIYYDSAGRLSQAGIWVRQRDGQWEGKIRQAGDYNQSQFKEIQDHELIREQVASLTGVSQPASSAFGLRQMADIATLRESWLADGRFKIVLNQADFGHVVGEVELELEVSIQDARESKESCARLDREIAAFMQKYSWAFEPGHATGKLTAYFAQEAARRSLFMTRLSL